VSKLIGSVVAAVLLLAATNPSREKFAKYKAVEAYEIRPGILMMPSYSADGQVCESGLERLLYPPGKVSVDSILPHNEIDQIFDELVPSAERSPKPTGLLQQGMSTFSGRGMVSDEEYQNVSIQIYSNVFSKEKDAVAANEVIATLKWKNRNCQ
jgi:hypothetical protein